MASGIDPCNYVWCLDRHAVLPAPRRLFANVYCTCVVLAQATQAPCSAIVGAMPVAERGATQRDWLVCRRSLVYGWPSAMRAQVVIE